MDTVFIKGLQLQTLIGVYDFERKAKQRIIVDVELNTALSKAAKSDDVADTVDYAKVAECLDNTASASSYRLLEALGEEMIRTIFLRFSVEKVALTINKPDVLDNVDAVGIVIARKREDVVN